MLNQMNKEIEMLMSITYSVLNRLRYATPEEAPKLRNEFMEVFGIESKPIDGAINYNADLAEEAEMLYEQFQILN